MRGNITPERVKAEFERSVSYNQNIGLYNRVEQNEHFFVGNQWEGVSAPNLEKPVINMIKRVVLYFVANIVSDDIGVSAEVFGGGAEEEHIMRVVTDEISRILENTKARTLNRKLLRDCAVDGDACLYVNFDPYAPVGDGVNATQGEIVLETVDNTNIYFGNPECGDVQKQPWIIIMQRRTLEEVKTEAEDRGKKDFDVQEDRDANGANLENESGKTTVLIRLWKENGVVWACKVAGDRFLMEPEELGYRLYPVAYMSWDEIKNSYHGQAAVTGIVPNQIYVNKIFAMCMEHIKKTAFPKVLYNRQIIPGGLTNRVGEAIGVNGDPAAAVASTFRAPEMSAQVLPLVERIMEYTKEAMGASDAALGNIRPENTSAIIAVQKSAALPLELNRMSFYQFVEDYIRVFIDVMRVNYGRRPVEYQNGNGEAENELFDFSQLERLRMKLDVSIGASTYWSEIMQVQTTDNLYAKGIIQDAVLYLESIPDGYIKNKAKIIEELKARQEEASMQSVVPGAMPEGMPVQMPGG